MQMHQIKHNHFGKSSKYCGVFFFLRACEIVEAECKSEAITCRGVHKKGGSEAEGSGVGVNRRGNK